MADNIYTKLLSIRKEVSFEKVRKSGLSYKVLDGDTVLEMVGNALYKRNIVFIPSMTDAKIMYVEIKQKQVQHALATLELIFVDADTGETLTFMTHGSGQSYEGKALGIAQTYGIKYFFYRMFLKGESDIDDEAPLARDSEQPSPSPRQQSATTPPPSELDDKLDGSEPDTRPRKLALETFPFNDSDKYLRWQDFIAKNTTWNKVFWPAVDALGLSHGDVHDALDIVSTKVWDGGNVARLWLTLCEEKIARDDIAEKANES